MAYITEVLGVEPNGSRSGIYSASFPSPTWSRTLPFLASTTCPVETELLSLASSLIIYLLSRNGTFAAAQLAGIGMLGADTCEHCSGTVEPKLLLSWR